MCQLSILQCAAIFWALLPLLTQQGLSLPELYLIECRPEGLTYAYAMDNVVKEKEKLGFGMCVTFSSVNIGLLEKRTTNAKVCCTAF
jgi:hypothetical protein